MSVNLTVRTIE